MTKLVVISNRVSLPSDKSAKSGGLAVALADALQKKTLWFGWSGKIAETSSNEAAVQRSRQVTYRTLDLSPAEYEGYYKGFANNCIYPLLLYRSDLAKFNHEEYKTYLGVCERFAENLAPHVESGDLLWVHDNHLLSISRFLGPKVQNSRFGYFSHIPFPPAGIFEVLPCARELLQDWMRYDVVGFQTQTDCDNFRDTCRKVLGAELLDNDTIAYQAHFTKIVVEPVGIDGAKFQKFAEKAVLGKDVSRLRESLAGRQLIIGAERLDYSKGLPARFEAYGRLFEKYPMHLQKVSYLQVAPESRKEVPEYQQLKHDLDRRVGKINGQFSEYDWVPIRYINRSASRKQLAGFFRCAHVGLVTPYRDGFNLVCEEFVAAQSADNPGVLILSKFAGAADTLKGALLVNPHDREAVADAIHQALQMPFNERLCRWSELNEIVLKQSASRWCAAFLRHLAEHQSGNIKRTDIAPLLKYDSGVPTAATKIKADINRATTGLQGKDKLLPRDFAA